LRKNRAASANPCAERNPYVWRATGAVDLQAVLQVIDPILDVTPLSISLVDHAGCVAPVGGDEAWIVLRLAPRSEVHGNVAIDAGVSMADVPVRSSDAASESDVLDRVGVGSPIVGCTEPDLARRVMAYRDTLGPFGRVFIGFTGETGLLRTTDDPPDEGDA
jgi:hypothetical protein